LLVHASEAVLSSNQPSLRRNLVAHPLASQASRRLLSVAHSIGTQQPGNSHQQESLEDDFDHDSWHHLPGVRRPVGGLAKSGAEPPHSKEARHFKLNRFVN
jgi:hypothetical protein